MKGKQRRKRVKKTRKQTKRKTAKHSSVQKQVRDLMLKAITDRNLTIDQLSELAGGIVAGAADTLRNALPTSRKSVLRKVLNGIDDAWAATAKASAASIRHAQRYGLRVAKRDVTQLRKKLGAFEQEFVSTINRHARRLGGDIGKEMNSLARQMRKAGTQIRPAAEQARKAIVGNEMNLAQEVLTVGTRAGRQAIRGTLLAASGLLEGAGRAVGTIGKRKSASK